MVKFAVQCGRRSKFTRASIRVSFGHMRCRTTTTHICTTKEKMQKIYFHIRTMEYISICSFLIAHKKCDMQAHDIPRIVRITRISAMCANLCIFFSVYTMKTATCLI